MENFGDVRVKDVNQYDSFTEFNPPQWGFDHENEG